jgi:hypothetical protein
LEGSNSEAVKRGTIKNGYDLSDGTHAHQAAVDAVTSPAVEDPPEIKVTTAQTYMEPTSPSTTIAYEGTVTNVIDTTITLPTTSILPKEHPVSDVNNTPPRYSTRRDRKDSNSRLNKGIP